MSKSERASLWQPILEPARDNAETFFRYPSPPLFRVHQKGFHPINAWWAAQLSLLVYQESAQTRQAVLARVGMKETACYSWKGLHWSKFEMESPEATVVCFRGTANIKHWLVNISTVMMPWDSGGLVHSGFRTAYDHLTKPLREELSAGEGSQPPLYFAGHSLGGALAQMAGTRFPAAGIYGFGAPRVGNPEFSRLLCDLPVYRIVNRSDLVPHLPHRMEIFGKFVYEHGGTGYWIGREGNLETQWENLDERTRREARQPLTGLIAMFQNAQPPPCLSNHAPSAYVTALEKCLKGLV
ncbi:MAG: lipase family protein [Verrucomicrobiota bacterium]